jgi:transposase
MFGSSVILSGERKNMRRLQVADADVMRIAIQDEIGRSPESRYDHRLHGVLLISSGQSCYQVADLLGQSPRTVENWVRSFEQRGFAGLQEGRRSGRPSKVDETIRQALAHDLRQSPRDLGYPQTLWDGPLLRHHLAERFGLPIGVRQCQRLFHQLEFRRRHPRPVIAKGDLEAQAAYKKTPHAGRER